MGQSRVNAVGMHGHHLNSRIRRNEDPQPPAREDTFDLLECELILSFLTELFDSFNAVANMLLMISRRPIMFERPR